MYEEVTFELLLQRMLDRVPSDLDKREGSVLYTALAPAAVELQNMYLELDKILNETFASTASRENLIKRAEERGLSPQSATPAVWKASLIGAEVPAGTRFYCGSLNFTVQQKAEDGSYTLQCEQPGTQGNSAAGALTPVGYVQGLTSASLTELLIPGEDEEDTEAFRQRYLQSFDSNPCAGNTAYYRTFCHNLAGVGGVKVYPVWNGGGTVRLVLLNSEFQKPSDELIQQVQQAIDPPEQAGQGVGGAPIGHTVTVQPVQETTVNLSFSISYEEGWSFEDVSAQVEQAIDSYFLDLAKTWEESDGLTVRISWIESRILEVEGIVDVGNTLLNGEAANLSLASDFIPKRGQIDEQTA